MRKIKIEKLKLCSGQGYWFWVEYSVDGVVRYGEGCHFSDKKRVTELKEKYQALIK